MSASYDIFLSATWPFTPPAPPDFLGYTKPVIPAAHLLTDEQRKPYKGPYKSRMTAWSYNQPEPTTPLKTRLRDLKAVHNGYLFSLAGAVELDEVEPEELSKSGKKRSKNQPIEVNLEKYVDYLLWFLTSAGYTDEDVNEFLTAHSALLEAGTFCSVPTKFSKFLDEQWRLWRDRHGIPDAVVDPNEVGFVVEPVVKKKPTDKKTIIAAFSAWADDKNNLQLRDELLDLSIRFGGKRGSVLLSDVPQFTDTKDDVGQRVGIAIWEQIENYDGPASEFFNYLWQITNNVAARSFNENLSNSKERAPLQIQDRDDPTMLEDNPALYREELIQYGRILPDFIQGYDRQICDFIRHGLDYDQIAKTMGLTETGVKQRVAAIRSKVRKWQAVA